MDLRSTSTKSLAAVVTLVIVSAIMFGISMSHTGTDMADVTSVPSLTPSPSVIATPTPTNISTPTPVVATPVATPKPTPALTYAYRNGSYTAIGSYSVPGRGSEQITVTVIITNDAISASTVTAGATNNESLDFQSAFIGGYKPYVIGKSVGTLSLGRISGASLTPKGFNSALAQIRTQAKK